MRRWLAFVMSAALVALAAVPAAAKASPDFLRVKGTQIVDGSGKPVLLRGMGLGGWMLQEGYMLKLPTLGQQHVIRRRIEELVGAEKTEAFYRTWLDNYVTKADVDAMARWGFNSIRLPMHHALFLDPDAPAGTDRWREDGFRRVDRLLEWAAANRMYLFLDLHAAAGGQGTDLAISDRDPARPSLWGSEENQRRTVALWARLAERYASSPWIGGYDLVNEPNWDFEGPGGGHGCNDKVNAPILSLYKRITAAIRAVDRNHIIVLEGNCWGNNYSGIPSDWDGNLVLSFHKYWDNADEGSLAGALKLREQHGRPVWLGESGENSNAWFARAIKLVEGHGIGWAWWPLKKIGFNNPLEVVPNPGWQRLVEHWTGKGPRPTTAEAEAALMQVATHDIVFANNIQHPDVIDAMFRQPHDERPLPFRSHRLGRGPLTIAAVDYDLGPPGVAYHDRVVLNRHVATGGKREEWNDGRTYRNDGVDIARRADATPVVTNFEAGEWLQYSLTAARRGPRRVTLQLRSRGSAHLEIGNGSASRSVILEEAASDWQPVTVDALPFTRGTNRLRVAVRHGTVELSWIRVN